jgi:DNA-binding CsgD family transcriptional regulator
LSRKKTLLTVREVEVLRGVADDLSAKEIATRLGISPRTVELHRQEIKRKLEVKRVGGMVRYAIKAGLIEP